MTYGVQTNSCLSQAGISRERKTARRSRIDDLFGMLATHMM